MFFFRKRKFNNFVKTLAQEVPKTDGSVIDFTFAGIARRCRVDAHHLASWLTASDLVISFFYRGDKYKFKVDIDGKYSVEKQKGKEDVNI